MSDLSTPTTHELAFALIWPRYPRRDKKIASRDALRWAWQNHNADGQLLEKIQTALTWQLEAQPDWHYWTSLDKWLLGQRWEDDPPLVVKKPLSEFEQERAAKHQRAMDQVMEAAKRRQA